MSTETKAAHTAGLWHTDPDSPGAVFDCDGQQIAEAALWFPPDSVMRHDDKLAIAIAVKVDNARLIASAPVLKAERDELLAALRDRFCSDLSCPICAPGRPIVARCEARDAERETG